MTSADHSSALYEYMREKFDFLCALGFRRIYSTDACTFASSNFHYSLVKSLYGERPEERLTFIPENVEGPDPYSGLQYYLADYFSVWDSISKRSTGKSADYRAIETSANLLQTHSWIIEDPKWLKDPAFLLATKKAQDWLEDQLSHGRFPSLRQHVEYLQTLK